MKTIKINFGLGQSKYFNQRMTDKQRLDMFQQVARYMELVYENCFISEDKMDETTYIIEMTLEQYKQDKELLIELCCKFEQDCISVLLDDKRQKGMFIGPFAEEWENELGWSYQYFKHE